MQGDMTEAWASMRKVIQRVTYGLCFAGMLLLVPMMLLTSADVLGRVIWARPIPGTVELSSYLLAVFILLGIAYTHQVKGHVRVSILATRLGERGQGILDIITTLLSLLIIGVMGWQGWVVGMEERTVSDMLRIPQHPFRLLVALAGLFLFLELLIDLVDAFGKVRGR
jgi:TRAP-type C4-dicarboxylate transport system permease small subunit